MGAVDLVVQIESPPSVASALQRVGRAGHQVGEVSRGVLFPKHRGDLAQTAVAVERMRTGGIEALRVPANPLDVLAQQVVAATALDAWDVDDLFDAGPPQRAVRPAAALGVRRDPRPAQRPLPERRVRRAAAAHRLGPGHRHAHRAARAPSGSRSPAAAPSPTAGCSASSWSGRGARQAGRRARRGDGLRVPGRRRVRARRHQLADRGHHPRPGAGLPGAGRARAAAVLEGRHPRPARPSSAPRSARSPASSAALPARPGRGSGPATHGLDEWAADNLVGYLDEQLRGHQRPARRDRTLLVERFRDELGDWRLVVHSPYGTPVHAPWALAINARLRERYGVDGAGAWPPTTASCSGSPRPTPSRPAARSWSSSPTRSRTSSPTRSAARRCSPPGSASAPPGRCCSPAATPAGAPRCGSSGSGRPQLLEVAAKYPSFPIVLEAVRECLQDVYDLPALVALMRAVDRREVTVADVATRTPSPFARSAAVRLRRPVHLRGRLPHRRAPGRRALPRPGPARRAARPRRAARAARPRGARRGRGRAAAARPRPAGARRRGRGRPAAAARAADHRRGRRALRARRRRRRLAGRARRRPPGGRGADGRRRALERGRGRRPAARRARRAGAARHARRRSPSRSTTRWPTWSPATPAPTGRSPPTRSPPGSGSAPPWSGTPCSGWPHQGRVLEGEFRPAGSGREWCDAEVLRRLRRRSLAALRKEVEPVEPRGARPVPAAWQHVRRSRPARRRRRAQRGRAAGRLRGARLRAGALVLPPGCATTSRPCSTS